LLIFTFKERHLPLSIVLLLLALLKFCLCGFHLFLDVCEEQVLVQRVYLSNVGGGRASQRLLRNGHPVIIDDGVAGVCHGRCSMHLLVIVSLVSRFNRMLLISLNLYRILHKHPTHPVSTFSVVVGCELLEKHLILPFDLLMLILEVFILHSEPLVFLVEGQQLGLQLEEPLLQHMRIIRVEIRLAVGGLVWLLLVVVMGLGGPWGDHHAPVKVKVPIRLGIVSTCDYRLTPLIRTVAIHVLLLLHHQLSFQLLPDSLPLIVRMLLALDALDLWELLLKLMFR
jgi:hypothetical protein